MHNKTRWSKSDLSTLAVLYASLLSLGISFWAWVDMQARMSVISELRE